MQHTGAVDECGGGAGPGEGRAAAQHAPVGSGGVRARSAGVRAQPVGVSSPAGRRVSSVVKLAHVFLQVEVSAESLSAQVARERLLLGVCVHVERQVVDLVKRLVADRALVLLVGRVRQLVVLVVALLVEALAATLAHERLVALVDAHVCVERRRPVERLVARLALVRLLGRVDDLVPAERARLSEALAAHLADEWPRARVHRHVARQVVVSVEHLAALGTSERLRRFAAGRLARGGGAGVLVLAGPVLCVRLPPRRRATRLLARRVFHRQVERVGDGRSDRGDGGRDRVRLEHGGGRGQAGLAVELRHLQRVEVAPGELVADAGVRVGHEVSGARQRLSLHRHAHVEGGMDERYHRRHLERLAGR